MTTTVLLIEDDRSVSKSLLGWFSDFDDVEVTLAETVAEATAAADNTYDLVLSDNQLPDGYGEQWLPAYKNSHPDTVCILHSAGYSEREVQRLATTTGLDGVYSKGMKSLGAVGDALDTLRG